MRISISFWNIVIISLTYSLTVLTMLSAESKFVSFLFFYTSSFFPFFSSISPFLLNNYLLNFLNLIPTRVRGLNLLSPYCQKKLCLYFNFLRKKNGKHIFLKNLFFRFNWLFCIYSLKNSSFFVNNFSCINFTVHETGIFNALLYQIRKKNVSFLAFNSIWSIFYIG